MADIKYGEAVDQSLMHIAYIRKSRVIRQRADPAGRQPKVVSYPVQLRDIQRTAQAHGVSLDELTVMTDWGRSGGDTKMGRRVSYREFVELVRAGRVASVFGYDMTRLTRGMAGYLELGEVSVAAETNVIFAHGGTLSIKSAEDRLKWTVMAAVGEYELNKARDRSLDVVDYRRERGDRVGPRFYGDGPDDDVDAVIKAVDEAGSLNGAARLLNAAGLPTRNGTKLVLDGPEDDVGVEVKLKWSASAVRGVLMRVAPERVPSTIHKGHGKGVPGRPRAGITFYRLLRCHCDRVMTGRREWRTREGKLFTYVRYTCADSRIVADHGPAHVSEPIVLAWAKEEASHLRLPSSTELVARQERNTKRAAEIASELDLVSGMVRGRHYTLDQGDAERAKLEAELAQLDLAGMAMATPALDWEGDVAYLNEALRSLWVYVQLDKKCRPVRAEWTVPEWRDAGTSAPGSDAAGPG